MNLQNERRNEPYPFTWEIPAGVIALWLLLACLTVHVGRAIASLTSGAGWAWPQRSALFSSLPAVLAGNPAAGLATLGGAASPAPPVLYGWIITTQILLLVGMTVGGAWTLRRWGPGRMKGMASLPEAEQALGLSRLRRVAPIIRPDLHPGPTPTKNGDHAYQPGR